jgi:hypothetical protein
MVKRVEVEVSDNTKEFLVTEAKRLNQTVKGLGGRILTVKVQSFTDAADSDVRIQSKLSAIIGQLAQIDRSITSLESLLSKKCNSHIKTGENGIEYHT